MREYKIDLSKEISNLTWRRFCILLSGLSRDSYWMQYVSKAPIIVNSKSAAENVLNFI